MDTISVRPIAPGRVGDSVSYAVFIGETHAVFLGLTSAAPLTERDARRCAGRIAADR